MARRPDGDEEVPANLASLERDRKEDSKKRVRRASLTLMDSVSDLMRMHGSDMAPTENPVQSGFKESSISPLAGPADAADEKEIPPGDPLTSAAPAASSSSSSSSATAGASSSEAVYSSSRVAASITASKRRDSITRDFGDDFDVDSLVRQFGEFYRDMDDSLKLPLLKRNFLSAVYSDGKLPAMDFEVLLNNLVSHWMTQSRISPEALRAEFSTDRSKKHRRVPSTAFQPRHTMELNRTISYRIKSHPSLSGSLPSSGIDWVFLVNVHNYVLSTPLLKASEIPSVTTVDESISALPESPPVSGDAFGPDTDREDYDGEVMASAMTATASRSSGLLRATPAHTRISTSEALGELERELSLMDSSGPRQSGRVRRSKTKGGRADDAGGSAASKGSFLDESLRAFGSMFGDSTGSVSPTQTSHMESVEASVVSKGRSARKSRIGKVSSRRALFPSESTGALMAEAGIAPETELLLRQWGKTSAKLQEIVHQLDDFEEDVMTEVNEMGERMMLTAGIAGRTLDTLNAMYRDQRTHFETEDGRIQAILDTAIANHERKLAEQAASSLDKDQPPRMFRTATVPAERKSPGKKTSATPLPSSTKGSQLKRRVSQSTERRRHNRSITLTGFKGKVSEFTDFTAKFGTGPPAVIAAESVPESVEEEEHEFDELTNQVSFSKLYDPSPSSPRAQMVSDLNTNVKKLLSLLQVQIGKNESKALTAGVSASMESREGSKSPAGSVIEYESVSELKSRISELEQQCKHKELLIKDKDLLIGQFNEELSARDRTREGIDGIRGDIRQEIQSCIAATFSSRRLSSAIAPDPSTGYVPPTYPPPSSSDPKLLVSQSDLAEFQKNQANIIAQLAQVESALSKVGSSGSSGSSSTGIPTPLPVTTDVSASVKSEIRELTDLTTKLTGEITAVSTLSVMREEMSRLRREKQETEQALDQERDERRKVSSRMLLLEEENAYLKRSKLESIRRLMDEMETLREQIRSISGT